MSGQNLLPFSGVPEGTAVGGASSTIHSHDVVRPPELGGQVFSEPILERLGSPPTVEDERVAKKVRNETALVNDVGVADSMEIEHASLEVAGLDGASDVAYDSTRFRESSTPRVRASYVSMVRNSSSGGHQSIDPDELTPDKVIVRDEDCVIDRRTHNVLSGDKRGMTIVSGFGGSRFVALDTDVMDDKQVGLVADGGSESPHVNASSIREGELATPRNPVQPKKCDGLWQYDGGMGVAYKPQPVASRYHECIDCRKGCCSHKGSSINLVRDITRLCGLGWQVLFRQVSQSENKVADALAKLASTVSFNVVSFDNPPLAVVDLLYEDHLSF
ncbi:hypothetical protein V6N13_004718 [Hibiscus sabdariffa]